MSLAKEALNERDVKKHLGEHLQASGLSAREFLSELNNPTGKLSHEARTAAFTKSMKLSPYHLTMLGSHPILLGHDPKSHARNIEFMKENYRPEAVQESVKRRASESLKQRMQQSYNAQAERLVTSGRHSSSDLFSLSDIPKTVTDTGKIVKGSKAYSPNKLMYRGHSDINLPDHHRADPASGGALWSTAHPELAAGYASGKGSGRLSVFDRTKIPKEVRGKWTTHIGVDPADSGAVSEALKRHGVGKLKDVSRLAGASPAGNSPTYETVTKAEHLAPALVAQAKYLPVSGKFMWVRGKHRW